MSVFVAASGCGWKQLVYRYLHKTFTSDQTPPVPNVHILSVGSLSASLYPPLSPYPGIISSDGDVLGLLFDPRRCVFWGEDVWICVWVDVRVYLCADVVAV